jgi:hypothetical protein
MFTQETRPDHRQKGEVIVIRSLCCRNFDGYLGLFCEQLKLSYDNAPYVHVRQRDMQEAGQKSKKTCEHDERKASSRQSTYGSQLIYGTFRSFSGMRASNEYCMNLNVCPVVPS